MQLRPYQEYATIEIAKKLKEGKRKCIFQLATGGGKTVTFSAISSRFVSKSNQSVLILVHRSELLNQTRRTLYEWYGITAQPIVAGMRNIPTAPVYVGMVESVNRRIDRIKNVGLVIIDEAHLGNFKKVMPYFPTQYIIGFTATPLSASKKDPLKNHFDDIVCGIDIPELIESGSLLQCKTYSIKNNVDRKAMSVTGSDFNEGEMAAIYKRGKQLKNTIAGYEKFCLNKKTLVFNVNIEHSILVCQEFVNAGYNARHIDGSATDEYRRELLSWLKNTPNAILCNVGILTTGFDEPTIECVIVNKATMSLPLWLQMTGRGARPSTNKDYFTILDLGGNATAHGDWCDSRDWKHIFENPPKPSKDGVAPVKDCPECMCLNAARASVCKDCGFEFPPPESANKFDTLPVEFTLITKNISVPDMIEKNETKKDYYTFFQIGNNLSTQAKYKIKKMSDEVAQEILTIYFDKAKEWCHAKGKKFNQWHKDTAKKHLYDQLQKTFSTWQPTQH